MTECEDEGVLPIESMLKYDIVVVTCLRCTGLLATWIVFVVVVVVIHEVVL